jgi:replication factor A1
VIGIVLEVQPVSSINLKDGNQKDKRTVIIGDDTNKMIGVTLWGDAAHKDGLNELQVVAFRACRVSEYRGKSLNASSSVSDTVVSPNHPRCAQLKRWCGEMSASELRNKMESLGGETQAARPKDAAVTIDQMAAMVEADQDIQSGQRAGYYNVNCFLTWFYIDETGQRQLFYLACQQCKKKVTQENEGYWCINCNRQYESAVPTYNFQMKVADMSQSIGVSVLGEMGEDIMGKPAKEFYEMKDDVEAIKNLRSERSFVHFNMTIRAKKDMGASYSQEMADSVRYQCIRVTPHSFVEENKNLLTLLSGYET